MSDPLVGFRFYPNDEELISHYLYSKIHGNEDRISNIAEINVYKHEPWDLPKYSAIQSDDQYWYFFCRLGYKYNNSRRANRTTKAGYWKENGKPGIIKARGTKKKIGIKRALYFHLGRHKKGVKSKSTNWVMHEFHLKSPEPVRKKGLPQTLHNETLMMWLIYTCANFAFHTTNSLVLNPFVICCIMNNEDEKADISTSDEGELGPQSPTACENYVATPELTPQLLEDLQLFLAEDGQDSNFPSAQESQFHVEQGPSCTKLPFTNGSSNGFEGSQSQFNMMEPVEGIDFATSGQVDRDGYLYYPCEEHLNTSVNDSSPPDPSRSLSGGDSSYSETETINAWENIFSPIAAIGGHSSNST